LEDICKERVAASSKFYTGLRLKGLRKSSNSSYKVAGFVTSWRSSFLLLLHTDRLIYRVIL